MQRSPTSRLPTADVVIDLSGDRRHLLALAGIVRAMADTGIGVDADIAELCVHETVRQPLQPPLPPPSEPRVLRVLSTARPMAPSDNDLTDAVIELARHLIATTLRNRRPPDLMAEVVNRALDHFHPAAMLAALEAEEPIRDLLVDLVTTD